MNINLRLAGLLTFATGLLALLPLTISALQAKEGDEIFDNHLCASVYRAVTSDPADANYEKMQFRYYAFSEYTNQEAAAAEINRAAMAVRKSVAEGKIEPQALIDVVKECARVNEFAEPAYDYPLSGSSGSSASSASSTTSAAPAGPTQAELACESASDRYRSILQDMPGRLAAQGPRTYTECDRPGPLCSMERNNSKWYYEMGRICSELKPVQEDIRRQCGEVVPDLDEC